ncbi:MAG: family 1 glycosylhydrolase, partial [Actinomycetaceae bacterium]
MDLFADGAWLAPTGAEVVTAPAEVRSGGAAARRLADDVARVRAAGRACLIVLGPDPAPTRDGAAERADLARAALEAAGDGVDAWLTMRDPLATARAAGGGDPRATLTALHHVLLGHGAAARALREAGAGVVGTSIHLEVTRPADPTSTHDLAAALDLDLMTNHVVLGPLLDGTYPVAARAASGVADWGVRPGDLVAIRRGLDVLVVEHSGTRTVARAGERAGDVEGTDAGAEAPGRPAAEPGANDVLLVHEQQTTGGRAADPSGLYEVLTALDNAYQGIPLLGAVATGPGEVGHGGGLAAHEAAAREAATDGADVRGLLAWEG